MAINSHCAWQNYQINSPSVQEGLPSGRKSSKWFSCEIKMGLKPKHVKCKHVCMADNFTWILQGIQVERAEFFIIIIYIVLDFTSFVTMINTIWKLTPFFLPISISSKMLLKLNNLFFLFHNVIHKYYLNKPSFLNLELCYFFRHLWTALCNTFAIHKLANIL